MGNNKQGKNRDKKVKEVIVDEKGNAIENKVVEEVQKEEKSVETKPIAPPTVEDLVVIMSNENDLFDANHAAIFLNTLERRISKMKPNATLTLKLENMLDYNLAWYAVRLSVQSFKSKKDFKMCVPQDEQIIQEFINTFSSMGVALEAHPTPDGQTSLEFKEIPEEIKKEVKEEIKQETSEVSSQSDITKAFKHKVWTEDDLNPMLWTNLEEAKAAIKHMLSDSKLSPSNRFLTVLMKYKVFKQNTAASEEEKNKYDTIHIGELYKELIKDLDTKKISTVTNGMFAGALNAMKTGSTVIFGHCILKRNMPQLNDSEIRDLIMANLEINHIENTPIIEDSAMKKGVLSVDRDLLRRIVRMSPNKNEDLNNFKKIFNPLYSIYTNEIGTRIIKDKNDNNVVNPDFEIKAVNKMIEIVNLYRDEKSAIKLFTATEYPEK